MHASVNVVKSPFLISTFPDHLISFSQIIALLLHGLGVANSNTGSCMGTPNKIGLPILLTLSQSHAINGGSPVWSPQI